jgi:diguanylate cyclase (GGDEF)-like protein
VRAEDTAARMGGEEFMAVLPDAGPEPALRVAERLRQAIAEMKIADPAAPGGLSVTVSIGVASAKAGETPEALMGRADAALYRAKQAGRNRVVVDEAEAPKAAAAGG